MLQRQAFGLLFLLACSSGAFANDTPFGDRNFESQSKENLINTLRNIYLARQGLNMETISNAKIEGTYRDPSGSGEGIHFLSERNGLGGGRITISTLKNEPIVHAEKAHKGGAKLISMLGENFLVGKAASLHATMQSGGTKEYVIPEAHLQSVQSAIQYRDKAGIEALLHHLDSASAASARERVIRSLMTRAEVQMMTKAAKALGESGISGKDNDAARVFYVYAMRLNDIQRRESVRTQGESFPIESIYGDIPTTTQRSYTPFIQQTGDHCTREGFEDCAADKCPTGEYCRGMCGPGCWWCWYWVCDDCCYHEGCALHDDCCGEKGYMSWKCAGGPLEIECDFFDCGE